MYSLIKLPFGSDLYGTRTPTSDTDYKGVHVPSAHEIIMQSMVRVVSNSTGSDKVKNSADDIDDESFSILKFFDMLRKGDMVAAELLFVPEEKTIHMTETWKNLIIPNRHKLLARDVKGFVGYIRTQVNKYGVKGSRIAAARNITELFQSWMLQYGATTKIRDVPHFRDFLGIFCDINEYSAIINLPVAKGSEEAMEYLEVVNRKVNYNIMLKEAHAIYKRVFDEFGARALAAEQNEGVDWKAVYHAIRVSEQAIELLETEQITFPRQNAAELLTIKRGEHKFKDIANRLENNLDKLEKLMLVSNLAETVDEEFMDKVVHDLHLDQIKKEYDLLEVNI